MPKTGKISPDKSGKFSPDLTTADESSQLELFIDQKRKENVYILRNGDIERYFPLGLAAKDLDNVFTLLSEENIVSWKETNEYKYLETIISEIIEK